MQVLDVNFYTLLLLAIAAGGVSVTISWSAIFGPFRLWLMTRAETNDSWINNFFADLFGCHYCLGHYVALLFYIICPAYAIKIEWFMFGAWIINYFLLVTITSFISTMLMLLIHGLKKLQ